ncbi:glycosyltransferase family 2 protein [Cutibacterium equinum]|uniref:Glycosyltransferase family 2 protein n=1 Tax=Cutibacterium equinum TaxID=3016342 RepID=A0ABY7QXG5_9ACTN|nr:glycosyltransferase family 2 protein [Cutibacterium equinum]WCC79395.1 glycosyltransferase family 2 protein [Cutibacterium equinum]
MSSYLAPPVSVVIPVKNEERYLEASVDGVLNQGYPGPMEIILVIAPSTDRTAQIAQELADRHEHIRVIDNPDGTTPKALNLGVAASRYDIIVRVDAHGELGPEYITTAVELLERTGAANVGGIMDAKGRTPFEQAVAVAYTSKLGLGSSAFHQGDAPEGPAETVFLGVFRKADLEAVGGFCPEFDRAQDWELNYRLRQSGRQVWFSPNLRVTYRPRSTVTALAKQFFRTGKWRREVMRRHHDSVSLRYLAAPIAVTGIVTGTAFGIVGIVRAAQGKPWLKRWPLIGWAAPLGYAGIIGLGSAAMKREMDPGVRARLPLVLAVMHMSWGAGFLVGLGERSED